MANHLPPESVLFNVSFRTKTNNRIKKTLSQGRGIKKKTLTLNFVREEYQMSQLILQLGVAPIPHGPLRRLCFGDV